MTKKEKLFETFGELLYVVAMADGVIQENEIEALTEIIKYHPYADEIKWSFNYEHKKESDIEDLYQKVISNCHFNGPSQEYSFFIDAMKALASASDGICNNEDKVISRFSSDLIERFQKDLG